MDYFNMGAMQHLNDFRMDPSLTAAGINRRAAPADENFAALFERTRTQVDSSQDTAPVDFSRRLSANPNIDTNDELFHLLIELETFLVKNLLSSMRNTVQKSGFINESFAGQIYEDMLWDEYAKDFTRNAGVGLAETAYLQMTGRR